MPITSVKYADIIRERRNIATMGLLIVSLVKFCSAILWNRGLTTSSINVIYTADRPSETSAEFMFPAFTRAITAAKRNQAVISLAAAQVIAVMPTSPFVHPRSCTIRANTGNAVMLTAIPINRAKEVKPICFGPKLG